ncbi:MAG: sigma 54-dependent Fis family transcriptional regulator [Deltaproteobacteria bacterium]|nr:sigma 54-dependent Fis family transcriptional regulator [Deltaproteobacteria bacterium]
MVEPTRRLIGPPGLQQEIAVPRFEVRVISGPDAETTAASADGRLIIGSGEGATLRLNDTAVSRFHLELEATEAGIAVRDLGSTNGTRLGRTLIREIVVAEPIQLEIGATKLQLGLGAEQSAINLSHADSFGSLVGSSSAMRAVYAALERAAPTQAPVLVTGESGTGKELAARAIHGASPRKDKAFEVVDCGGLPPTLIESELFGHEKGAFTGASGEHEGAFERADGGTLFLDELGELPLELQPKLLRALGEREIRRLGAKQSRKIDVRIVAATNRDLRREVNAGRFRADLFYRLAVIQVRMPSLRDRLEDLPLLAARLLQSISADLSVDTRSVELGAELWQHSWPGNVRELRNYLEQLAILKQPPAFTEVGELPEGNADGLAAGLDHLPLTAAKNEVVARFERRYLTNLLEQTKGNVAEAARISGVNRATLFRMIRRYGLREGGDGAGHPA